MVFPVAALSHALALQMEVGAQISPVDLAHPTPCAGWTVRDVLAHSLAVTNKFAGFAARLTDAPRTPRADLVGLDHRAAIEREATRAVAAWEAADLGRTCFLPFGTFTSTEAASLNMIDVMAHTWDVAVATGVALDADSQLWARAHEAARLLLGRNRATEHCGPEFPIASDAPLMARFVGYMGRRDDKELW